MKHLKQVDPEICAAIRGELVREQDSLELIASENFTPVAVLEAQGSVLTNKYAEGYPGKRYYGGCEFVDKVEQLAIDRVKALFGAEYANVQPHSGSQANMAVFFTLLQPGDTYLAMDLACGGHLSHGLKYNFSGKFYNPVPYGLTKDTERIDYAQIRELAKLHKPKFILAGASAYSREIDFKLLRQICDETGAALFVDMAHIAGLVAAGLHMSPVPYADIVTSTTHKTLRGPRGGFILARKEYGKKLDSLVFPGMQGGPLMHVIAAKAVAFRLAATDEFKSYQQQIVRNSSAFARAMADRGYRIISGGTDNHLFLMDLSSQHINGKETQELLESVNITVNKNLIPFDPLPPSQTSGIRLGTPAVTSRGLKEADIAVVAECIDTAIRSRGDAQKLKGIQSSVLALCRKFPLYPELKGILE